MRANIINTFAYKPCHFARMRSNNKRSFFILYYIYERSYCIYSVRIKNYRHFARFNNLVNNNLNIIIIAQSATDNYAVCPLQILKYITKRTD